MDFELNKDQIAIRQAAEEFARGEFDPDAALEYDQQQRFPKDIWKKACDLGFVGILIPEQYGGQGFGRLENTLIVEAFCRCDSGIGMALALSDFGSEMILVSGSEEQKKRLLPGVAAGKEGITLALQEQGYGIRSFSTIARRDNGAYVVNGEKSLVPFGDLSRYLLVVCRVEVEDAMSPLTFLLEGKGEGIEVRGMGEMLGMRMIPWHTIGFRDVRVSSEALVGGRRQGESQLDAFLNEIRIEAGAMGVGIAQGALDRALEHAKKREQFGMALAGFDAVRNKLAHMYMDVEMARLVTYRAAWAFDNGRPDRRSALLAKAAGTGVAGRATYDALQIHGGLGYMKEAHIEQYYRDAKALDLFLEPGRLQKRFLADEMTGKQPRRPMG